MIKDNHIHAVGSIEQAVAQLKAKLGHTSKIEVECESLPQVQEALRAGADIIMLDNMTVDDLQRAVSAINKQAITEASGGITLQTVMKVAQTGVDYISTSELTLSAPAFEAHLELK